MLWSADELHEVACDACGSTETARAYRRPDGLTAVECARCGLCFVSPRPIDEAIGKLYDKNYFQDSAGTGLGYATYMSAQTRELNEQSALRRLSLIGEQLDVRGKRLLEVGCATGEFAAAAAARGAKVVGLDLSSEAIAEARRRHPALDLRAGDVFGAVQGEFDLVCGFEVLEHVPSPTAFLARIRALLRPGGHFVLSTPNHGSTRVIGDEPWLGFHISFEHLYYFSPETLAAAAQKAGMELAAHYTSGNARLPAGPEPRWKTLARPFVRRARVLDLARRAKLRFVRGSHGYGRGGTGYNLFAFLRAR